MISLVVIGIVLMMISPFTLIYDPSGLNLWFFAGLGTLLALSGLAYEFHDCWQSWRRGK